VIDSKVRRNQPNVSCTPMELTFILASARRLPVRQHYSPIRLGVNAVCKTGRLARVSLPLSG